MGRQDYKYWQISGARGINQQEDLADPLTELADARNLWAPDGAIQSRPGERNFSAIYGSIGSSSAATLLVRTEGGGSTINLTSPNNPQVGDFLYFGVRGTATPNTVKPLLWLGGVASNGLQLSGGLPLSTNPFFTLQYWNGTEWAPGFGWFISVQTTSGFPLTFAEGAQHIVPVLSECFRPSGFGLAIGNHGEWTRTTLFFNDAFWFRIKITNEEILAVGTPATYFVSGTPKISVGDNRLIGAWVVQFASTKRYISLTFSEDVRGVTYNNSKDWFWTKNNTVFEGTIYKYFENEPPTIAVIPQFDEAYTAYDYKVRRHEAYSDFGFTQDGIYAEVPPTIAGTGNPIEAKVEQRPEFIGPGAPYDKNNYIAQLATWPECKYITFFEGRLWCAGIKDDPFTIRWSAPQPYHKVWPLISAEPLMEDDNSPITGLQALGEHMIVFKQDSIWIMVDTGINEFGLQTYSPKRVVAGVGCAANSSIQKIRGRLVFLAEDGIYAFDGTPNIEKLSDRVSKYISKIPFGRRPWCASLNWRERSCYLLSVANTSPNIISETFEVYEGSGTETIDARNNLTLVWDYKNNSWWAWDNMSPRVWISDEGVGDQQNIYYGTDIGQIREFGKTAFTGERTQDAWLLTQRQWERDYHRKTIRSVKVDTGNDVGGVWVERLRNDEEGHQTRAQVLADDTVLYMPNKDTNIEKPWGVFDWSGTSSANNWSYSRRVRRKGRTRRDGDWHRIKLWHLRDAGNQTYDGSFEIDGIELGMVVKGRR